MKQCMHVILPLKPKIAYYWIFHIIIGKGMFPQWFDLLIIFSLTQWSAVSSTKVFILCLPEQTLLQSPQCHFWNKRVLNFGWPSRCCWITEGMKNYRTLLNFVIVFHLFLSADFPVEMKWKSNRFPFYYCLFVLSLWSKLSGFPMTQVFSAFELRNRTLGLACSHCDFLRSIFPVQNILISHNIKTTCLILCRSPSCHQNSSDNIFVMSCGICHQDGSRNSFKSSCKLQGMTYMCRTQLSSTCHRCLIELILGIWRPSQHLHFFFSCSSNCSWTIAAGCIILLKGAAAIRKYRCYERLYLICK